MIWDLILGLGHFGGLDVSLSVILIPIIAVRGIRLGFEDKYKVKIPVIAAPVNLLLAGYLSGIFEPKQTLLCLITIAAFTFPLSISVTSSIRFGKLKIHKILCN